jgi:hypothetical protein
METVLWDKSGTSALPQRDTLQLKRRLAVLINFFISTEFRLGEQERKNYVSRCP